MFHKTVLVAVALGLIAAASSLESPRDSFRSHAGMRIPRHKRNGLKVKHDVFDFEQAAREDIILKNKHRQNLMNIKKNGGHDTFTNGASIKPIAPLPMGKRASAIPLWDGRVPLTNHNDSYWTGSIVIGDPEQIFTVEFDTGTSDLSVSGLSCQSCGKELRKYDPSMSSQSQAQPGVFNGTYQDEWNISGIPYTDIVGVGRIRATNQSFAVVTQISSAMFPDGLGIGPGTFDGVMGMGLPALSTLGQDPFFQTVVKQNAAINGTFAFKFGREDSELFLGGTNQNLYTGDIEYHTLSSNNLTGYWAVGPAKMEVNGQPGTGVSDMLTIIDSSSGHIIAPPAEAAAFYALLDGSEIAGKGLFSYPCESTPEVAFNWGGNSWKMSVDDFNLGRVEPYSPRCVGAIKGIDFGLQAEYPVWVLGRSFMKNVYTVFSVDTNSVGFAELR